MAAKQNWQCPFCERHVVIRDSDVTEDTVQIGTAAESNTYFTYRFITCPNSACQKLSGEAEMMKGIDRRPDGRIGLTRAGQPRWKLLPRGNARVFPDYVPSAIRNDEIAQRKDNRLARRPLHNHRYHHALRRLGRL